MGKGKKERRWERNRESRRRRGEEMEGYR